MLAATLSYHFNKCPKALSKSAASVFCLFPFIIGAKLLDQ
jgi:hypothetical protein